MSYLTHLTSNVIFWGHQFAILAMFFLEVAWFFLHKDCTTFFERLHNFFWRACTVFCVERLHDFVLVDRLRDFICWEVEWFCVWRGCVLFPTQSLRLCIFFVEILSDFFLKRVRDFFVWRGCMIFGVKNVFLEKVFWWNHLFGEKSFSIDPALRLGRFMVLMCLFACLSRPIYFFVPRY